MKVTKDEDDDLWGSMAAPARKTTTRPLNVESATTLDDDDDDPWAPLLLLHLLPGPNQWQLVEAKVHLLLQNWALDVLVREVIQG
ncbi:hypothetical protein NC651_013694 [Populus alba x Populus x berolinensis]|nr:hypothetical protein NC651_013694 [Populus alba x Populus x berolinensis]